MADKNAEKTRKSKKNSGFIIKANKIEPINNISKENVEPDVKAEN